MHPGVLVYTVDSQVVSGNLPLKIAGGTGNGVFVDFPVLTEDQSVTVRGYTIEVTEDRGGVHRVQITKNWTSRSRPASESGEEFHPVHRLLVSSCASLMLWIYLAGHLVVT